MPGATLLAAIALRKQHLKNERIKKRHLRDFLNPMDTSETCNYISFYGLNRRSFQMVLEDLAPKLPQSSIPANIQLAAVLRFLAVGSYQADIANDVNISMGRSTFCKILWNVLQALEENLCPAWISLEHQVQSASKKYFYRKFGIPGVIGCVDGTLIKIMKPPIDHSVYFSRKGHYSLNAMMICDYDMRILAVDESRPGSCHDSFVWNLSDAKRYDTEVYNEGGRNLWLLGDSGYALKPYLMTPYKNPNYGTAQHTFNQRHASARNVVERTIGVLKSRFRCLQNVLLYTPLKVVTIINVCCALHNVCKHFAVPFEEGIITNIDNDEDPSEQDDDVTAATVRDNIAQSLHSNNS